MRMRSFTCVTLLLVGPLATAGDMVLDWNATLRDAVKAATDKANPGWSTRAMAMTNGAMYDVLMAFDRTHEQFLYVGDAPAGASRTAAVAQAAYKTLLDSYGGQQGLLDDALAKVLDAVPNGPSKASGIAFGESVAQAYIASRTGDGSDDNTQYMPIPGMGHWQPDDMHPTQQAWGPKWGAVKPFVLTSSGQFAVPGTPAIDSQAYTDAYNQVKELGALNSATRTPDQTDIGRFWGYDHAGLGPPPVMYDQNLTEIGQQMGNTASENARMFAMASVALADAGVAAWDSKFVYDFWRPITAIRNGDSDGNANTAGDGGWIPLGAPGPDANDTLDDFTPPFPAYVSGHATFGGATYETLRNFFGTDNVNYSLTSEELQLLSNTRNFTSFSQAEYENAISRIYLGIHWIFDATDGIALGNQIADYVAANHFQSVPEPGSWLLAAMGMAGLAAIARRRRVIS